VIVVGVDGCLYTRGETDAASGNGAGRLHKARLAVAIGGQFEDMGEGQGDGARPFGPV
jgi:hypothetical protein